MVKNPLLAYTMGQCGCVASETTKVCCNVDRAVLSSWDTLGNAPESEDVDSSDDLMRSPNSSVPVKGEGGALGLSILFLYSDETEKRKGCKKKPDSKEKSNES